MKHLRRAEHAQNFSDRNHAVCAVAAEVRSLFGDLLLAMGRRNTGKRLVLLCVLGGADGDYAYDWPWRGQRVLVVCRYYDGLMWQASTVDPEWTLVCGELRDVVPLYDPHKLFDELHRVLNTRPPEAFAAAVEGLRLHLLQAAGEVGRAWASGQGEQVCSLGAAMARQAALMLALAHRWPCECAHRLLHSSLLLPNRPPGYDDLCRAVTTGDDCDPLRVAHACEMFRRGLEEWLHR
ncbi:MAG: kanamycin nucleotidyltransferase C-terminal domain-containing protein [Armatimonadota bacterium]|nr:kanamycin nucleotidyltransferase C-terminal domain-containing protein [Armatimonadota bacterium]